MAIFIAGLAYDDQALIEEAKIGILAASIVAAVIGFTFLRLLPADGSGEDQAPADD